MKFKQIGFIITAAASCFVLNSGATNASAQPAPTTAPATSMPTTAPVAADATTPKGTLTLMSRSTESGDGTAVRALLNATNPLEERMAEALVLRTESYAKFRAAATKAFGEEESNKLTGNSAADAAEAEQKIAAAPEKIENDKAAVIMDNMPVNLVKVDGKWKLSLAELVSGMEESDVDEKLSQIKMLSKVVTETTDEINAGKYKKADEVNTAINGKLASAMLADAQKHAGAANAPGAATTQPATQSKAPSSTENAMP